MPCGTTIQPDPEILKSINEFDKELYRSSNADSSDKRYVGATNMQATLNVAEREHYEGRITLEECTAVVNSLKKNKSAGLDGLTAEFYQAF